uniref:C-type lectin domain-containing protein n=1 Tax=Chelonoidis abingdonii TaxID=106734 RepID=A0A8C0J219_CHEAB
MAGEVVYADLNIPGTRLPRSSQPHSEYFHQCPHWHQLVLKIGAAGYVVLLMTVIVLSVWGKSLHTSYSLASVSQGSRCVLCPRYWLPYKEKCYWVSKETRMWNSSHEDCIRKSSHLLVTQDQEEMDYIQTITSEKNSVWIGLNFKSPERTWIWVDGSPFNENLPGERDCGVLKRNQIASETCSAELKWICRKDALLI